MNIFKQKKRGVQNCTNSLFVLICYMFCILLLVGMTGFEPATTRPPDEYSKPD